MNLIWLNIQLKSNELKAEKRKASQEKSSVWFIAVNKPRYALSFARYITSQTYRNQEINNHKNGIMCCSSTHNKNKMFRTVKARAEVFIFHLKMFLFFQSFHLLLHYLMRRVLKWELIAINILCAREHNDNFTSILALITQQPQQKKTHIYMKKTHFQQIKREIALSIHYGGAFIRKTDCLVRFLFFG